MTLPFSSLDDNRPADYYRRVADRLARLQGLTAALARAGSLTEIADVLVREAVPAVGAEIGVLAVVGEDGWSLRYVRIEGESGATDSPVPISEAARLRVPVLVGGGAVAALPLLLDGRLLGALGFRFPAPRAFDDEERAFLQTLAEQCALAVDRAELYDELRDTSRRKDEFMALLAHELRNPLGPIRHAVEVMRRLGFPDPRATSMRDTIDRQSAHMARIVDDLLDVFRLTRGALVLRKERLDLVELVRAAVEDHRACIEGAGLVLAVSVPEGPVWAFANPTRLSQSIANLLHNGQKFTESGGTVRIDLTVQEGTATIEVSDTGIGLPRDMLRRVFEPFAQADRIVGRRRGGLGLGLALVKGLVEAHGGSVVAESEGAGRGTRFTIRLAVEGSNSDGEGTART